MVVQSRIADYLRKEGIKQVAVCRRTGITDDKMSRMLAGKTRMTADEYEAICIALGKNPNFFMEVRDADDDTA